MLLLLLLLPTVTMSFDPAEISEINGGTGQDSQRTAKANRDSSGRAWTVIGERVGLRVE